MSHDCEWVRSHTSMRHIWIPTGAQPTRVARRCKWQRIPSCSLPSRKPRKRSCRCVRVRQGMGGWGCALGRGQGWRRWGRSACVGVWVGIWCMYEEGGSDNNARYLNGHRYIQSWWTCTEHTHNLFNFIWSYIYIYIYIHFYVYSYIHIYICICMYIHI